MRPLRAIGILFLLVSRGLPAQEAPRPLPGFALERIATVREAREL